MLAKKGAERNGKVIIKFGLNTQIDENGAAALIHEGRNWMATRESLQELLGATVSVQIFDENGNPTREELKSIHRVGARGKKFRYDPTLAYRYSLNGKPVLRTAYGTPVDVDQFGFPIHPDAYGEKQYYSMDGELVTLNFDFTVKEVLNEDLKMPIFLHGEKKIALSFQRDRYAIADMDGKCLLFDQSGIAIDDTRVMKFERLIRGVINKTLPLRKCVEGSYFYEDLIAVGHATIVRSLIKCDSDKALTTVSSTSKRKKVSDAERLKYKQENPEAAIAKCEENWVQQALFNEFRRLAWKHSEKEKGGRAVSMTLAVRRKAVKLDNDGAQVDLIAMMNDCEEGSFGHEEDFDSSPFNEMEELIGSEEAPETYLMDVKQANEDMDRLLEMQDRMEGIDSDIRMAAIQKEMSKLSSQRQEDLAALLKKVKIGEVCASASDAEIEDEYEQASIRAEVENEFDREEEKEESDEE